MSIAQVVFDLPIDGPFDYLVPEHLVPQVAVGCRLKVSFGPKTKIGFVVGLSQQSALPKLKPVISLCDTAAVFNDLDLVWARDFSAYYGCSLGEALATILRNRKGQEPSLRRDHKPLITSYRCRPDSYAEKLRQVMDGYPKESRFLVLVPDAFRGQTLSQQLKIPWDIKIGTRSCVFEADGRYACIMMVDDEDSSFKQEQMPMYETRQVLLTRGRLFGFDIAFVGICPSVELIALVRERQVRQDQEIPQATGLIKPVDLSNYKFIPGLVSPPVRDALEMALKAGKKSLLVLNRKGSYRLTRCVDCSFVLKCSRCDSPLIYSRAGKKYICRHCTFTAPGDMVCPQCGKPSWRSQGIGVEQLQTELKKIFPRAKILSFERPAASIVKNGRTDVLGDFDILIATQAVLRFQGKWKAQAAAFVDFDAQLNRLDMRAAFNAFSLALHVSSMAESVFIQSRNLHHHVLEHLARGDVEGFYDEELKLRKEFGFSPFKHWIKLTWRGKSEKSAHQAAAQVYNELNKSVPQWVTITPVLADALARKHDQYRFNVMVQADDVPGAVAFIKSRLAQVKRRSQVIITLNVDP